MARCRAVGLKRSSEGWENVAIGWSERSLMVESIFANLGKNIALFPFVSDIIVSQGNRIKLGLIYDVEFQISPIEN
jgi:hypothetical protein